MRFLLRTFFAFCLILAVAIVTLAALVFEKQPLVRSNPQLEAADLNRFKEIFEEHDPRQLKAGTTRTITLSKRELTLIANYLLKDYYGSGVAVVELQRERLVLKTTLQVPYHRWGYFLNLRATWVQAGNSLRAGTVHVGGLPVPGWLVERILRKSLRLLGERAMGDLLQRVAISRGMLAVTYRWQPELLETVRRRMIPKADARRLHVFHTELARLAYGRRRGTRVSINAFLKELFEFAAARQGDPVADNRAIILVLGAYVNARGLAELVPEARTWRVPKRLTLILAGRKDLALHFLTSATLAVMGGGVFSDSMGVYKEMADARMGSGFSFSDLAADRAGTRFSELATGSPVSARRLWKVFAGSVQERDYMPSVKGLPEFMKESAFRTAFGKVGSPAYNRLIKDVEERISALSLYRKN